MPAAEALNERIIKLVAGGDMALDALVWSERGDYAEAMHEELLRAVLFGLAEIYLDPDEKGKRTFEAATSWVNLPFSEAIRIFRERIPILSARFRRLSDAAKAKSWTIAGDHSDYTRAQVKDSLQDVLEGKLTRQEWLAQTEERFAAWGVSGLGQHHLETVFDTCVLGGYQNGRWKQQNTPEMIEARPILVYETQQDARVRPAHAALQGFTAHRDHPAWETTYPPNGHRCRCRVRAIRERQVRGKITPNDKPTPINPDTGEPAIPDAGFASNPGEWLRW